MLSSNGLIGLPGLFQVHSPEAEQVKFEIVVAIAYYPTEKTRHKDGSF
jgi:hypothetical protein